LISAVPHAVGRTTGHIADITIENPCPVPRMVELPAMSIPSDGKRQGFIVPNPTPIDVPANGRVTVPLHGFCTNHDLPPPSAGALVGGPEAWPASPFPNPDFFDHIRSTIRELQDDELLVTPFSGEQERDFVLQQFVWYYSNPTRFDPCLHLQSMASDWFRDTDWYSSGSPNQQEGIAQVVGTMLRVGSAANLPDFFSPGYSAGVAPVAPPAKSTLPAVTQTAKAKGTGRTTGHIADITISNPTKESIRVLIGNGGSLLIPPRGRDQPYVVPPIPPIEVPPGATVTTPVIGYCSDIRRPPTALGAPMPDVNTWIQTADIGPLPPGAISIPVRTAPTLQAVTSVLQNPPLAPVLSAWECPDVPASVLIPGTDIPIQVPIDLNEHPGLAVPVLLSALNLISETTDEMIRQNLINTPFSGNPAQEREAVIQQTLWIFSAALEGNPYTREDFHGNTVEQFNSNTGRQYDQLPETQQTAIDQGVDDFWNTFQAVGVAAKILPETPEPVPAGGGVSTPPADQTPQTWKVHASDDSMRKDNTGEEAPDVSAILDDLRREIDQIIDDIAAQVASALEQAQDQVDRVSREAEEAAKPVDDVKKPSDTCACGKPVIKIEIEHFRDGELVMGGGLTDGPHSGDSREYLLSELRAGDLLGIVLKEFVPGCTDCNGTCRVTNKDDLTVSVKGVGLEGIPSAYSPVEIQENRQDPELRAGQNGGVIMRLPPPPTYTPRLPGAAVSDETTTPAYYIKMEYYCTSPPDCKKSKKCTEFFTIRFKRE
jgi:hypothetical protein